MGISARLVGNLILCGGMLVSVGCGAQAGVPVLLVEGFPVGLLEVMFVWSVWVAGDDWV